MTAKNEADNSEEPAFVDRVNTAASQLHSGKSHYLLLILLETIPFHTYRFSVKIDPSFIAYLLSSFEKAYSHQLRVRKLENKRKKGGGNTWLVPLQLLMKTRDNKKINKPKKWIK